MAPAHSPAAQRRAVCAPAAAAAAVTTAAAAAGLKRRAGQRQYQGVGAQGELLLLLLLLPLRLQQQRQQAVLGQVGQGLGGDGGGVRGVLACGSIAGQRTMSVVGANAPAFSETGVPVGIRLRHISTCSYWGAWSEDLPRPLPPPTLEVVHLAVRPPAHRLAVHEAPPLLQGRHAAGHGGRHAQGAEHLGGGEGGDEVQRGLPA